MLFILVTLQIPKDALMRYYQGTAKNVIIQAEDGRIVQFPVEVLRPFVTHSGVQGRFKLSFNKQGKFEGIEKINEQ